MWRVRAIKDESGAINPPQQTASRPEKPPCFGCVTRAAGNKGLAGPDPTAFCRHRDVPIYFPPLSQQKKGGQGRARRAINRARDATIRQSDWGGADGAISGATSAAFMSSHTLSCPVTLFHPLTAVHPAMSSTGRVFTGDLFMLDVAHEHVDPKPSNNSRSGKSSASYLDALDAGFAVVAFDVDFNFGVADEAETHTKNISRISRLQMGLGFHVKAL